MICTFRHPKSLFQILNKRCINSSKTCLNYFPSLQFSLKCPKHEGVSSTSFNSLKIFIKLYISVNPHFPALNVFKKAEILILYPFNGICNNHAKPLLQGEKHLPLEKKNINISSCSVKADLEQCQAWQQPHRRAGSPRAP